MIEIIMEIWIRIVTVWENSKECEISNLFMNK